MGDLCPEVRDLCIELGYTSPSKQRWLQKTYDHHMENAQSDFDFGGHVLTYLTRQGSRPVDRAVGERVARRLAGR